MFGHIIVFGEKGVKGKFGEIKPHVIARNEATKQSHNINRLQKSGDAFYPTPTLVLPLKGRQITTPLPLQGGGEVGGGLSVRVLRDDFIFNEEGH